MIAMGKWHIAAAKALAGVSAVALAAGAAQAQEAPQAAGADQAASGGSSVGDIVVTARKRSESLRDVPVAITALSGETLQRQNITQMIDIGKITPSFNYTYGAANSVAVIRGFGSGGNAGFEQAVGKFVDNVSYGRDQEARIPIFDVERVEVLKGPQVLTFGNSATAGALNISTKKPGDEFEADGSIGYEFYGREFQAQTGVTVPLSEGMSLRVAGLFQNLDRGRYDNPVKGEREPETRNYAIRPSLRLQPADGLDIVLRAELDRIKDRGNTLVPTNQPLVGNTSLYPVVGDKDTRYVNTNVAPFFTDELAELEAQLYQADINYDIAGGTLTSTTAWRKSDGVVIYGTDGINHSPAFVNGQWTHYKQFSQELRFGGTFGKLDATVGGYYQRDTLAIDANQELNLGALGLTGTAATPFSRNFTFDQKNRVFSAFVDLTYHLTDQLSLSGGVRYSDTRKKAGQSMFAARIIPNIDLDTSRAALLAARDPSLDGVLAAVLGGIQHAFPMGTFHLVDRQWQPQAIVQYKFSPNNMAYVKYVKGAKVGGFDYTYTTSPANAGFGSEKAWMVEAGIKGLLLDNRLDYSIAVFREEFNGLQQSVRQGFNLVVSNIGKARSQGVELDLNYRVTDNLRLGFNGAYLDAKYISFVGAACNTLQNARLAPGCVGGAQDLSGTPTPYSSKWTGSFNVEYVQPVGNGNQIAAGASVFARTKYNAGSFNDPRMVQNGYAQLDAHIDFGPEDGRWAMSLFGRNLTDKRLLEVDYTGVGSSTSTFGSYSRGRQIGLKLRYNIQ